MFNYSIIIHLHTFSFFCFKIKQAQVVVS